jgi:hypothetical protein
MEPTNTAAGVYCSLRYALCMIRTLTLYNAQLNPIRHLLALAGTHHFVHVSRIKVKPTHADSVGKCAGIALKN